MAKLDSLEPALIDQLRDLYDAEKQLIKALPKLAKASSSEELRTAFEEHLEQTNTQIERLDRAFDLLGQKARAKKCPGMRGIIEEGQEHLKEDAEDSVMDAIIVGAAQKAEHYEIAAYGTARTHARTLGHDEVASLLEETLEEEKQTDNRLTEIAESFVNMQAAVGDGEEDTPRGLASASRSRQGSGKRNAPSSRGVLAGALSGGRGSARPSRSGR